MYPTIHLETVNEKTNILKLKIQIADKNPN